MRFKQWLAESAYHFKSREELEQSLDGSYLDQGKKGRVYFVDGKILKVTNDPPFERFAEFCQKHQPSSLFPVVHDTWRLADGAFCSTMERLVPIMKRSDAYQIEDFVEIIMTDGGDDLPKPYRKYFESLKTSEADIDQFVEITTKFGEDDIQVNNMGTRNDGSLVIFDPVK